MLLNHRMDDKSLDAVESYIRVPNLADRVEGDEIDHTLTVKRMDLNFNNLDCQMLNFTDVTD